SGNLIVETTGTGGDTVPAGNFVTLAGYSAKQNGQKNYHSTNKVRQDIVICEGHENDPQSLVVVGDLTGSPGTIWIWAERSYHYKQFMPFAVMDGVEFAEKENGTLPAGKLDAEHLQVFRNAQDDGKTDDGTGSWLYGTVEGETEGYVYWNGTSGIRKVILRKLDSTYSSVKDKSFTIYKATSTTAYLPKDQTTPLTGLTSLDSGIIFIGLLPYGWYIVEEDDPHRFFYIVVDGSGVYGTQETSPSGTLQNKIGGFDTREEAETEAIARYNALKAATP
ncbi:MAG: hypothetical protein J6Y90_05950, partial [Lachnospiraceae bacterium]|nr:hypothetical protein [Lachnospiraceae bacterium]